MSIKKEQWPGYQPRKETFFTRHQITALVGIEKAGIEEEAEYIKYQ
jgi:hypothetical protein